MYIQSLARQHKKKYVLAPYHVYVCDSGGGGGGQGGTRKIIHDIRQMNLFKLHLKDSVAKMTDLSCYLWVIWSSPDQGLPSIKFQLNLVMLSRILVLQKMGP